METVQNGRDCKVVDCLDSVLTVQACFAGFLLHDWNTLLGISFSSLFYPLEWSIARYLCWSLSRTLIVSFLERVISSHGVNFPFSMLRMLLLSSLKFILMLLLNFETFSRRFHSCLLWLTNNLIPSIKRR